MKTYYFLTLIVLVAMTSCGTAYQTGQTPDAVYYSPESEQSQTQQAAGNNQYAVAPDSDEGNYVVYQDGDEYASDYEEGYDAGYSDGYYSRRIQMFDRPGSLFSYNYNIMSSPWYGGSYYWNRFAWNGFGWYNSPYMWSPGLSFSLNWGRPYAFGGWYSPWYNPWYSYGHYYNYGYGYGTPGWGWGGKYMNYSPRPAVSYQPRRAAGSRASQTVRSASGNARTNGNAAAPRRVFTRSSSENVQTDNNTRARRTETTATSEHARRVYKPRSDETPVRRVRQNTNTRSRTTTTTTRRPTRRVSNTNRTRQVQRQSTTRSQPSRTISRPSSPAPRTSAPRTSSPRRR